MIFSDNNIEEQAKNSYPTQYSEILNNRSDRYAVAWNALLITSNLTGILEKGLRLSLERANQHPVQSVREQWQSDIQAKLDSGNFIPIGSEEETTFITNYNNLTQSFVWPSANELVVRQQEEQELLSYMQNNPVLLPQATSQSSEPTYLEILLQQHRT